MLVKQKGTPCSSAQSFCPFFLVHCLNACHLFIQADAALVSLPVWPRCCTIIIFLYFPLCTRRCKNDGETTKIHTAQTKDFSLNPLTCCVLYINVGCNVLTEAIT